MVPDWQLPPGVDRGLWDYLRSEAMVRGYDAQMATSPLAAADVRFCERTFAAPGRLADLGCGTGRLSIHFAQKGFDVVGIDLSDEMLAKARENAGGVPVTWVKANLVELEVPGEFDYASCLFSTLGMVRGVENRASVVRNAARLLTPGGRFVLHVHNRFFPGLGRKRVLGQRWKTLLNKSDAGDLTMPQAYGGAALTLHHFTMREAVGLLTANGFRVSDVEPQRVGRGVYGWLLAAERAVTSWPASAPPS